MDDKELVEVWLAEFDDWINSQFWGECFKGDDKEEYFKVWLAAKRSQPSVVLPKVEFIPDSPFTVASVYDADATNSALTAAGIKYTIGE